MTESLGKTVRERRRQLRLTQQDVSDLSGVSVRFLHDLEHDKPSVRMDVVLAALDTLGLELQLTVRTPTAQEKVR